MKEISKLNLIEIGEITKLHGYKGNLVIHLNISFENIYETEHIFVDIDGINVPFFISKNNFNSYKKNLSIIKLIDIDAEEDAKKLVGNKVLLPQSDIHTESKKTTELEGFKVFNLLEYIGIVNSQLEIPSNPILVIISDNKQEILIPFSENFIKETNHQEKRLILELPEGLIDLN